MLFRLGMTYMRRKTWKDSKTVFLQILKENPGYSFAWGYLGLALMKIGEYESAEEALNEANLLDVENPNIWAYLCIYSILVKRPFQAAECLNELMNFDFRDVDLLDEIAVSFCKNGDTTTGAEIYNKILKFDPDNVEIYLKLAGIYANMDNKKNMAIELLNKRHEESQDENDRKKINKFLEMINRDQNGTINSGGMVNTVTGPGLKTSSLDNSVRVEHDKESVYMEEEEQFEEDEVPFQ